MKARHLLILTIIGIAILLVATGIYAAKAQEIIRMENKAYNKHKKGIVMFEHEKHQTDYLKQYPELYQRGCGECHHDENNKPLSNLKVGDKVQNCIECHKKPSEMPKKDLKALKAKKIPKDELMSKKLEYHAEALHENCKGCHKNFNKKYKPKKAPTTCATCHPKEKK